MRMRSLTLFNVIRYIFIHLCVMKRHNDYIIVGEMSDSSVKDYVVYALTTSHLTLKCSCGYTPVMRRATKFCLLSLTISLGLGLIGSVHGHG